MNEMIVKNVDLFGDSIKATKDGNGQIWAGVSYFCRALGMSKVQKDTQTDKIQSDRTLKQGCRKFPAGVFDTGNETVAIRIDFIPVWLAKITITDKMQKDHPELADKLLKYQLMAKDILADAFMPKSNVPQTTEGQIQLLAQGHTELKAEVDSIKEELEQLKYDLPILPVEAEKITVAVRRKGVSALGGKQSQAYNNKGLRQKLYNNLYANLKYNFGVRSYRAIKRSQVDKAIEIVNNYQPPFFLQQLIENENAQEELKF